MIDAIHLTNFRRFVAFSASLRAGNILVGPNNSGKSSILDALRILEACWRRSYNRNPELIQLESGAIQYGYVLPLSSLPVNIGNVVRNYDDDDAVLEFKLANKAKAVIRLHPERQTRFYVEGWAPRVKSSSAFRRHLDLDFVIIPTLAPLEVDEKWVEDTTVQRNSTSRLASRVLRNTWVRASDEEFHAFRDEIEAAWPGIRICKPTIERPNVVMMYEEDRIPREVQASGFGFQVWLQLQTHLRRATSKTTLIIDEPDIYLHPDLQKKLLRSIRVRVRQYVMATHAIEIVNEADPEEIVTVNSSFRHAKRIRSEDDYAALYRYLGSTDNADFARIARAKRVIFVEGQDGKLLRRMAARFNLKHLSDAQHVPIVRLGGFSQWRRAPHAVWAFKEVLDLDIEAYCLFDRDYRSDEELAEHVKGIEGEGLRCSVLQRKEIENYLLDSKALRSALAKRLGAHERKAAAPSEVQVSNWLTTAADEFRSIAFSRSVGQFLEYAEKNKGKKAAATLLQSITEEFDKAWVGLDAKCRLGPGKEMLGRFNEIAQKALKVSVTHAAIVEQLDKNTFCPFLLSTLQELDDFCSPQ